MMTSLAQQKYIAFNNGNLLPDLILAWIIDAALRGKIVRLQTNGTGVAII